jgi:hypothetical protein
VWLSGAKGGETTATLTLGVVDLGLLQPPTSVRGLYTEVIAQKAQEAQEVKQGAAWASLAVSDGGGVLAAEREEGIGRWCSGGAQGME